MIGLHCAMGIPGVPYFSMDKITLRIVSTSSEKISSKLALTLLSWKLIFFRFTQIFSRWVSSFKQWHWSHISLWLMALMAYGPIMQDKSAAAKGFKSNTCSYCQKWFVHGWQQAQCWSLQQFFANSLPNWHTEIRSKGFNGTAKIVFHRLNLFIANIEITLENHIRT